LNSSSSSHYGSGPVATTVAVVQAQKEAENQSANANVIRVCPSTDSAFSEATWVKDRSSNSSDTVFQEERI
jgi:alkyl hydroperoxide reductase subunit AhpC